MPRGPRPEKRLKLDDVRPDRRQTTPELETPSPYETSPLAGESNHETRFPFPTEGSKKNPFPYGLPHANHYGAIRPRPIDYDPDLKLLRAPVLANWRPNTDMYREFDQRPYRNPYNTELRSRPPPPQKRKKDSDGESTITYSSYKEFHRSLDHHGVKSFADYKKLLEEKTVLIKTKTKFN
ncbi:unnamed protein product [Caenorhabditis brenneri]